MIEPILLLVKHFPGKFGCLTVLMLGWSAQILAETVSDYVPMFEHSIPLHETGAGSYTVTALLGGVESEMLLDTGASMVTISAELFSEIRKNSEVVKLRQVGARLASGKVQVMNIYRIESFAVGGKCDLGPIEVAVLKRGGRNLLGMNALNSASPFAVSVVPPVLSLSNCS